MNLIVGCGYTGARLARRLLADGQQVLGLVSSQSSAEGLADQGIPARVVDLDRGDPDDLDPGDLDLDLPSPCRAIHYLAPPPAQGVNDPRLARFLAAVAAWPAPVRLVYTSTTGVYGDRNGAWVDEDAALNPSTDRARRRAQAEAQLQRWSRETGHQVLVLRVAGIYGPGRLPLAALRSGMPVIQPDEAPFSNRIHVDDLVSACLATMARGRPGRAYNVADGNPSPMSAYYETVARLAGLPAPPRLSWERAQEVMSPGVLSFLRENRRVDSARLRRELGVVLRHPEVESGVRASLEAERQE